MAGERDKAVTDNASNKMADLSMIFRLTNFLKKHPKAYEEFHRWCLSGNVPSKETMDLARSSNFVLQDGRLDPKAVQVVVNHTRKEKGVMILDTKGKTR